MYTLEEQEINKFIKQLIQRLITALQEGVLDLGHLQDLANKISARGFKSCSC